jgi:hypothetical protein
MKAQITVKAIFWLAVLAIALTFVANAVAGPWPER